MSRGFSLHIGVDKVDMRAYKSAEPLMSPSNDAEVMAEIAKTEGYEKIKILTNETATKENFLECFNYSINELKAEDTFLLTFSGHGGQIKDEDGDDEDGMDEIWCFFNGYIIDDDLGKLWKEFRDGVRIIVVSASCHSRTALRVYSNDCFTNNHSSKRCEKEVEQNGKSILSSYIKSEEIKASILHISACEDEQLASDGDYLSKFTSLLVKHWDKGNFQGNYVELVTRIKNESGYKQRAGLATLGQNNPELLNSQPFKLLTK